MKPEQFRQRILAADLAWIPLALGAEQALCSGFRCHQHPLGAFNFVIYAGCTVLAWVLLSDSLDLDGFRGGWRLSALVSHLVLAVAILALLLLAIESVSDRYVGRLTLSIFALFLLKGFLAIRCLALRTILRRHRMGDVRRAVILGSSRLAVELAAKFDRHPELLCQVVGFLCPGGETPLLRPDMEAVPALATVSSEEVISLLRRHNVDELILAHAPTSNEILNLVGLCRQQAIRVSLVPQPYELYLSRPSLLDLGGLPLLQLGEMPRTACAAGPGKRVLDVTLGLVLALAAMPIILICAAALRFSTGRGFRWERRVGWRSEEFSMLRLNVERNPQSGPRFARLLWHFSLSELPQLWNVLRGEMSLVGPRPESPERAHHYSAWQQQRLAVKPGITGLAQVQGLREQHSSEDKTRHDLQYMLHPSLLKDLSLLTETAWTLALRLIHLLPRPFPGHTLESTAQKAFRYSPPVQPFPEMLPHAHRTQPGTD